MKSKKPEQHTNTTKEVLIKKVKKVGDITEYVIPQNGLKILYAERKGTGIVTSNIVYHVGARDEARGETGIAHMFEHMLFKPTAHDLARKTDSGAMLFEREIGCVLNANTWKDRTTYYFSYPKEYFDRAVRIEAERMHGLVLSPSEFKPEQTNVLSEFDMYGGDEQFALSVQMAGVALQSHPYGHETIGYREDIEDFTIEKLERFYRKYYAPNNATLIIVGDVSEKEMLATVRNHFGNLEASTTLEKRLVIREPIQEGMRSITIERPTTTQVYALGVLHEGFPSKAWFETMAIFDMLAGGTDSILHRKLIDTGLAVSVSTSLEPTYEKNLGVLFVTLSKKANHARMHQLLKEIVNELTLKDIGPYLKKTIAKTVATEVATRENSLGYVHELIEYVSAGAWEAFFDSEQVLKSITAKDVHERLHTLFEEKKTTVGHFLGTKKSS